MTSALLKYVTMLLKVSALKQDRRRVPYAFLILQLFHWILVISLVWSIVSNKHHEAPDGRICNTAE